MEFLRIWCTLCYPIPRPHILDTCGNYTTAFSPSSGDLPFPAICTLLGSVKSCPAGGLHLYSAAFWSTTDQGHDVSQTRGYIHTIKLGERNSKTTMWVFEGRLWKGLLLPNPHQNFYVRSENWEVETSFPNNTLTTENNFFHKSEAHPICQEVSCTFHEIHQWNSSYHSSNKTSWSENSNQHQDWKWVPPNPLPCVQKRLPILQNWHIHTHWYIDTFIRALHLRNTS